MERETVIRIENVKKQYRLGAIGGGTLRGDLQSWWARKRGREDPNLKIGQEVYSSNEKFYALNGISFEVYKGERLGIIGGNGAGKSTTLKLLSRVTAPTEGNIYIKGRISSMLEVGTGFHPELTGRENIYLNGAILGMSKAEVDSKIEDIIDFSECRQFIDTPVKRYSSGMYVKLAFSVAAHLDSEILVMDEVLAVGDMKFQQKCLKKMSEVAENEGRTVLYVSHNMNTIRQLCDRCVVLEHGKVIFNGEVEAAIAKYMGMDIGRSNNNIIIQPSMRDSNYSKPNICIEKIEFENESGVYKTGEVIKFNIDINNSSAEKDNVYLRIMVNTSDGNTIMMSSTEKAISLELGMNNKQTFCFDSSNIVPGNYSLSFVLYRVGEYGADKNVDVLRDVYNFSVTESIGFNHNMPWNTQWWGHISNGYIKQVER
ncbi:ABC transporter ATP-binding protein [Erysipelatoclostridium sp. An15]|uniref:ABC transporter ATP-binding protein n=1 Tax=Erysipelatoclostridium sp. An15 TaxID=1965566 RepID=UPI000B39CD0E|nr:polysaccharide ABC transporter ATP-binding protein [Erysipelatoclostridium sp. An15]OUQ07673.1 ABC transporter ATP-binding protein [Erysipelatoclostridium sp. An15]